MKILEQIQIHTGLRAMAKFVIKCINGELTGVEIGTSLGINAEAMLKQMNIKKLYLIDPYITYKGYEEEARWIINRYGTFSEIERKMKKRLKKYQDRYTLIKKKSSEAVKELPSNLDFVYIDGNHEYDYVMKDMELYYPKIKEGGILGGDDFNKLYLPEVTNAVIDFANKNNLQLYSYGSDWWIIKGEKRRGNKEILKKYGENFMHMFDLNIFEGLFFYLSNKFTIFHKT